MLPNLQCNVIKRFKRAKQKQQFRDKVQGCKSGSGLQFMKFDVMTGGQEIKIVVLVTKTQESGYQCCDARPTH